MKLFNFNKNKNLISKKKIFSLLFIFIVCISIFSPFSLNLNKKQGTNNFLINKNIAEAVPYAPGEEPTTDPDTTNTNDNLSTPTSNEAAEKDVQKSVADMGGECFSVSGFSVLGCAVQFSYWVIFSIVNIVAYGSAIFLDFFMDFSISDTSYRSGFVELGWKILKDLSNIAFIFALLWVAISLTLSFGGVSKKAIISIIVVALLINFSLFFTKVVIDTSNVLAGIFYNNMVTTNKDNVATKSKTISEALISQLEPQKFFDEKFYPKQYKLDWSVVGAATGSGAIVLEDVNEKSRAVNFLIIILIISTLLFFIAKAFFSVGLLFLWRVIGLWMAMIFAPLAMISNILPVLKKMKHIGWDDWLKNLISLSFLAPVFLFFLYLITKFLNVSQKILSGINIGGENVGSVFKEIVFLLIPAFFLITLINLAKKIATDMAGEGGKMLSEKVGGMLKGVVGVAGGVALGAGAMVGRTAIGGLAAKIGQSKDLKEESIKGGLTGWASRLALRGAEKTSTASFDVRATKLGAAFKKDTGIDFGKAKAGGYEADVEEKKKEYLKNLERAKIKGVDADVQDKKALSWQKRYDATKDIAERRTKIMQGRSFNKKLFEKRFEKQYTSGQDLSALYGMMALKDKNGKVTEIVKKGAAEVLTSKKINEEKQKQYAQVLAQGGTWGAIQRSNKTGALAGAAVATAITGGVAGASAITSSAGGIRASVEMGGGVATEKNNYIEERKKDASKKALEKQEVETDSNIKITAEKITEIADNIKKLVEKDPNGNIIGGAIKETTTKITDILDKNKDILANIFNKPADNVTTTEAINYENQELQDQLKDLRNQLRQNPNDEGIKNEIYKKNLRINEVKMLPNKLTTQKKELDQYEQNKTRLTENKDKQISSLEDIKNKIADLK